jgi:hypothetical protein
MSINNIHNVPISIKQEVNNGILSTKNAMPQKNNTSDNQSSFSMDRKAYENSFTLNPSITKNNPAYYTIGGFNNTSRRNLKVFDGTSTAKQKQWYGNRDASEIIRKNRVNSVGLGSLNSQGQSLNFESHANVNIVNDALRRVRGGGAVAPKKKNHNTHNSTTPAQSFIPWIRPQKIINNVKMPPVKQNFGF